MDQKTVEKPEENINEIPASVPEHLPGEPVLLTLQRKQHLRVLLPSPEARLAGGGIAGLVVSHRGQRPR